MPLSDHVTLTITQDTVGVRRAGFGVPMILSYNATFPERIRFYTDMAGVAEDFATTTSPEYLAAQAMFAQEPHPERIAIGRGALKPTLVYSGSVAAVRNSHTYTLYVRGQGVTATTVTYTSDADATNDEIVAGLVSALNAVVGNNYIAAVVDNGTSDTFTVTADAAGGWFSIAVATVDDLLLSMTHVDPGVATDLAAIKLADDSWYALYTLYNSNALVLAAAAWVESNSKVYLPDVVDSASVTAAVGNSDTLDDLKTLAYARTMGAYHPHPNEMFGAAWLGRVLPLEPGAENWKFKTLSGVSPTTFTTTHRTNLTNKYANGYEQVAGVNITFEGTTANGPSDNGWLDVMRGLDWVRDDMTKRVFEALAGADKIPYTDGGVEVIAAQVRGSLARAVAMTIFASDPAPLVTVPLVADIDDDDKVLRLLPDVKWSATLAGAINKVQITGVVSV